MQLFLVLDWIVCFALLPTAWANVLVLTMGALCALLWALPSAEADFLLWRVPGGPLRSMRMQTRNLLIGIWPFAACLALVTLLRGGLFDAPVDPEAAPISALLAKVCAWSCAFTGTLLAVRQCVRAVRGWTQHPARRHPPHLHVSGALRETEVGNLRRALRTQGFELRRGARPGPAEIPVRIQAGPRAEDSVARSEPESQSRWPLVVTLGELERGERRVMLMHRWHTQCRRLLVRRLRSLFKEAAARQYLHGEGFWIGIQHTCFPGLMRDQWEEAEGEATPSLERGMIGAPFREVFPRAVRQNYHRMMRDLSIDLVFVADGVRFAGLRQVLLTLFQIHDVYGADIPVQELHFAGVHNVRVLIQEVHGGSAPPRAFREPDYAEIGRARILMIFPDRRGSKFDTPVAKPADFVPVPS